MNNIIGSWFNHYQSRLAQTHQLEGELSFFSPLKGKHTPKKQALIDTRISLIPEVQNLKFGKKKFFF